MTETQASKLETTLQRLDAVAGELAYRGAQGGGQLRCRLSGSLFHQQHQCTSHIGEVGQVLLMARTPELQKWRREDIDALVKRQVDAAMGQIGQTLADGESRVSSFFAEGIDPAAQDS